MKSLATLLLGALISSGVATRSCAAQEAPAVFEDPLDEPALGPGWTVDVSEGNSIVPREGFVEIRAAENTHAHLERSLGRDHVRASCEIQPGSGVSWCTSLFLYWRPRDWCQIGVIPRGDGRYYVCLTTEGAREEHDLARCRFSGWHHVAIELGSDCIRFLSSADGKSWQTELFTERPRQLLGPPALLVVGKGFSVDEGRPDLDGDYGERGGFAVSRIRGVRVAPTAAERMRISAEEIEARSRALRDPLGSRILELPGDPGFDTVASLLPALARPREAVGVKDHPHEIGVEHDGTIQLADDSGTWEQTGATASFEVGSPPVRLGSKECRKSLLDGYLPIVVCRFEHDGLLYEETVFGWSEGMSPDAPLWAYARLRVSNPGGREREVAIRLRLQPEAPGSGPLSREATVPAGGRFDACFRVPSPLEGGPPSAVEARELDGRLEESAECWRQILSTGMRVSVPEKRVSDACRAWLAYNYLDVDKKGGRYEPHDGAGFYESVFGYSAALHCHALDLWGRHEDSRRTLESLLELRRADGLFYVNYGLPDHGALLFASSEHYRLTGDAGWLREVAPKMVQMGDWIVAQRKKSLESGGAGKPVTRGLIRFAPYADFQSPTCSYYGDAYSCLGLESAARVLGDAGLDEAAGRFSSSAAAYRADILVSMTSAVFERDGMRLLPMEPDTHRLLESTRHRGGGYYGLVASMLLETEFLPAGDERAMRIVDALERKGGLILGMCEFDGGVDHAYTYGYWLNCLRRNEVRRVLLGFYGTLAYGMGRETYCGVEVTHITTGEPTPTMPHLYSGTQQLRLLRMMLVHEEGGALVIGKCIPRRWLAPGSRVEVTGAATAFGPVSFAIEVDASGKKLDAFVDATLRLPVAEIRLHLRHAQEKPIQALRAGDGVQSRVEGECIRVLDAPLPIRLRVAY